MSHDPMLDGITAYTMDVACMSYCYGGSPRLEVDEYPDENCVVKWSDLPALIAKARAEERETMADYWGNRAFDHYRDGLAKGRADAAADVAALEPLYDPFPVFPRGPIAYLSDAVTAARGGTDDD